MSSIWNVLWLFLWHYELIFLSVILMFALLTTLIAIYLRLSIGRVAVPLKEKIFVHLPFSVYLGWITTNLVQNMMRDVALKSGLIDEKNNGKAFNPLGPHALRESFGSIMINSGVPDTIVDFWLGHSIGEMAEAYKSVQAESLEKMYFERERLLSISAERFDEKKLEEKVTAKVDERVQALQRIITNYATENLELKSKVARVELENTDLRRDIANMRSDVAELQRGIAKVTRMVEKLVETN